MRFRVRPTSNETEILCHCADCRKIGGSTYSSNAVYPEDSFKVTQGTPKQHIKKADGGNEITSNFWYVLCEVFETLLTSPSGDCGSTMWRQGATFAGKRIVKVCLQYDP